ncbi:flagellar motor protein MotB [Desulfocurvibacter africanus]|uniref:OmpA/MotB family protein n=1 Tax=Desulfocurvibacter africanus TaxID=873 RepID=UPI002FDA2CAB
MAVRSPLEKLRRRRMDQEGGEDWHLSLADMMTLLLCFFVLLASISQVDYTLFDEIAGSMQTALKPSEARKSDLREAVTRELDRQATLEHIISDLQQRFRGEAAEHVQFQLRPGAVAINLHGPAFFDSGSAELTPDAARMLRKIGVVLVGVPYHLTVEGHTDNVPIQTGAFDSNWELSALRATRVARFLISQGVRPDNMKIVGLADTRPLLPNNDASGAALPENQTRNRRVVILVAPEGN